jgi:glycosyltransferase involved in cell wall biosynthesis
MQQLMHDEARRTSLRKAGFARAQQFNWETTARQTLKVYQHLMRD